MSLPLHVHDARYYKLKKLDKFARGFVLEVMGKLLDDPAVVSKWSDGQQSSQPFEAAMSYTKQVLVSLRSEEALEMLDYLPH